MVESNNSMLKYAAAGVGAIVLGAAIWYLSADNFKELDYKKYTKEKLEALMKEVELEFTCIYTRNYNIVLNIKEADEYEDGLMDQMRKLVNKEIVDKTEQVCESYCFECHPKEHNDEEANHAKVSISPRQF